MNFEESIKYLNTKDLDTFLNQNNIIFERSYTKIYDYIENELIRYSLHQNFDDNRFYMVDICYGGLVTFEYECGPGFVSRVLFEDNKGWYNTNKTELFKTILEHITAFVKSDDEISVDDKIQDDETSDE
jgi:hypothetical protein